MKDKKKALAFFAVCILWGTSASFAHPVTPTIIKDNNLGDYMFGLALAVMMTTNFCLSPFWGKMNGFISSRVTLLVCNLGYAMGQFMFSQATTEMGVIIARMFAGLFTGGIFVAQSAYIVNTSDEATRGTNLTVYMTIQTVAGAFGYFIGGMLGTWGVQYAFMAQVVCLALAAVGYFFACVPDATVAKEDLKLDRLVKEANPLAAFAAGKQFLNKSWVVLLVVCGMSYMGYNAFEQVFNYYIKDIFNFGSMYNGVVKAVIGLVSLLANSTICLWLMKKTDTKKTIIPILGICSVTILGVIFSVNPMPYMAISVGFFAFNSVLMPIAQNLVADKANTDNADNNLIMGFYNAIKSLGGVIGPLSAGFLYEVSPKLPFWMAFAGFAISVVFAFWYKNMKHEAI